MVGAKYRRVWILGAGFSASLGAPLLQDLLSFRLRSRLKNAGLLKKNAEDLDPGPDRGQARLQELVYALYHYGSGFSEGYLLEPHETTPRSEKGLWRHPEEYLERLDELALAGANDELAQIRDRFLAALQASGSSRLMSTLQEGYRKLDLPPLQASEFADEARKIVAAECCEFLRQVTARSERAKPYVHWLHQLGKTSQDTIVSFNYDCVVEKLSKGVNREVLVAGVDGEIEAQEHRSKTMGSPLLIKLHGSVDWERNTTPDNGHAFPFRRSSDAEYAANNVGVLSTPGASKLSSCEGEFAPLWQLAKRKLIDAQEVVFVGYRIPESDAAAREMLLDALAENEESSVFVRVVLGRPSFDRERLVSLLEVALPGRFGGASRRHMNVTVVDAWAEDYLQAWRVPE